MTACRTVARWVPIGARVVDGFDAILYDGENIEDAHRAADDMSAFALRQMCGGSVLIDVFKDGDRVLMMNRTCPCNAAVEEWRASRAKAPMHVIAYPSHALCGAPMVPASIAKGADVKGGQLYCTGCGYPVLASADDRMRATSAATVEMSVR